MRYSLWMILEALQQFEPQIYIRSADERTIENIRLFSQQELPKPTMMYIAISDMILHNESNQVICVHNDNYVLLNTEDISAVFNCVLSWFEKMQTWYYELTYMLYSHCLLKDILNHFGSMVHYPLMVLDASQIVLASSAMYGVGSIDTSWDNMLATGSFGSEIINQYNQLHQGSTRQKEAYLIPANPFPHPSYNRNIYMDNEFVGFISMIIKDFELTQRERDWFDVLCDIVFSWFSLYADNNEIAMKQALFKEMLDGNPDHMERFRDALNALGWNRDGKKRLLALSCISSYLNMSQHIARIFNQRPDMMYAVCYDNYIVILVNEDAMTYEETLNQVTPILHSSGYYGGSSNPFTKMSDLPDYFTQARIALRHGAPSPGVIHACHDHILPYAFDVLKSYMKLELCHPAILALREYDENNGSDYCRLLYTYLQNECNQTKTADLLCIHRNSLIRKITMIQEMTDINLDDYDTRFHLLMSFEYSRQTS